MNPAERKGRPLSLLSPFFITGVFCLLLFVFLLLEKTWEEKNLSAALFYLFFLEGIFLSLLLPFFLASFSSAAPLSDRAASYRDVILRGGIFIFGNSLLQILFAGGVFFPSILLYAGLLFLFLLVLAHVYWIGIRLTRSPGLGYTGAAFCGFLFFSSPFLFSPLISHSALREVRPFLVSLALRVNPLCPMCRPDFLGVDWMRRDIMYRKCVIGPFYPYQYPSPFAAFAFFGILWILTFLPILLAGFREK